MAPKPHSANRRTPAQPGVTTGAASAAAAGPNATRAAAGRRSWRAAPAGTDRTATTLALSIASGLLWVFASADFDIWPLGYVAMVPLLWVVDAAATRRRALFYGWLAGLAANAGGFYWITELLVRFAYFPLFLAVLVLLLLAAYQALVFLLFAAAVRRMRHFSGTTLGTPLPMVILAPIAIVTFELLVPFIFPWYLAIAQAWVAPVIQIAEFTGPLGITAVLAAVNGAVYDLFTAPRWRRRLACAAGAAGCMAVVLGFGWMRLGQIDAQRATAPRIQVGVVQGNVGFDNPGSYTLDMAAQRLKDLQGMSADLERRGADLLLWTETAYPYAIARDASGDFAATSRYRIRRGFTVPLVLGAATVARDNPDAAPYNSALLLDREGRFAGRFDKIFLLVFGEYTPGAETFPFLRTLMPQSAGHFARGQEIVTLPLTVDGVPYRLGPMICYEDIVPAFGRKLAQHHPHLLVNLTNDTWFGDTSEPWQHLALSVFRAVEMRTDLVRAVNTGVSAFIDAAGRVRSQTYVVDPAVDPRGVDGLIDSVVLVEGGHTFYARYGDVFGCACAAATAALWLLWPWLYRRRGH